MSRTLQVPRNAWREATVEQVGLLVDGDDYYRAFYYAGQTAKHSLLLSGWQFDTDACLLRGEEAKGAPLPVTLLAYLDALCEREPALRIYILAWDFHAVFSLEREWLQQMKINWTTNDRLTFLFDGKHADNGSHHQKFVIIDGQLAFLGGLDLCDHRWDDRKHKQPNPLRVSRGEPHQPFHDVQAYVVGHEACAALTELFINRWRAAGGEEPVLLPPGPTVRDYDPEGAVPLASPRVTFSRTDPLAQPTGGQPCKEICKLFSEAIAGAERLIYVETQYFSSREIGAALAERLRAPTAPLDVVLILNMHAETFKEEVAVGLAQAKVIADLRAAAAGTPHRLGIYYTVPLTEDGGEPERGTYIHSKILIVDDRLISIGSANLTNRSMGVDTELNLSAEAASSEDELGRSITHARHSLLCEHVGIEEPEFAGPDGLVTRLERHIDRGQGRLRRHPSPTERESQLLEVIDPQQLPFDPASDGQHDQHQRSLFVGGIGALWRFLGKDHAHSS